MPRLGPNRSQIPWSRSEYEAFSSGSPLGSNLLSPLRRSRASGTFGLIVARARGRGHILRQCHRDPRGSAGHDPPHRDQRFIALEDRFPGALRGPWSLSSVDTLSKFDATSVVIPEIHVDITAQVAGNDTPLAQSLAYRDMRLDDIKAGKAARASVAGMTARPKARFRWAIR